MTSTRAYRRGSVMVVAALAMASLLAGCGGDDDSSRASANEWVKDVCTSLSGWLGELQQESSTLQSAVQSQPSGDLAAAKTDLVNFMNNAVRSTDEMLKEVEAAGLPDVDKSEEISTGLKDGLGQVRTAFADAETQAEDLPVDNPAAFAQGATELGQSIQEAGTKAQEQLNDMGSRYDAPSLDEAFRAEPACQQLNT